MLVDDHKLFREGIQLLLKANYSHHIEVVAEADSGQTCLSKLHRVKPDIILLDINMPTMSGIETLQVLQNRRKRPKILILSGDTHSACLFQSMHLGADGYIIKNSGIDELVFAIDCVYQGELFIQSNLLPLFNTMIIAHNLEQKKIATLSKREMEVLKFTALGYLNREIGDLLCISERTVKNHLSAIFRKIECIDRTQAALFCVRNGIISIYD